MLHSNNGSSALVASQDKELPPVPEDSFTVKTLNRKNVRKLSLQPEEPVRRRAPLAGDLLLNRSSLLLLQSQRNIDPDLVLLSDNIINQFSSLELSTAPPKPKHIRKRQTVVLLISPTKSTSLFSSPKDSTFPVDDTSLPVYSTTNTIKFAGKDLVTLRALGAGNSGSVLKILHIPTQKIMAKKVIPIESKVTIQNQIIRELKILHECQSPYIIEFYGAFVNTNNTIVICMEYCNCGSLDKIVLLLPEASRQFPLPVLRKLSYSILHGLVYLYDHHKIIHRDIKPSNVLMTHKGQFKISDFGVSRELTNSLAMADTFVGTSTYMSPERIQGLEYGIKSDIWSMGLMLIELASGKPIWHHSKDPSVKLNTGPEGILDLLQRIVNEDPPLLTNVINPATGAKYDPNMCAFIDSCLVKGDKLRKSPWDLLRSNSGFLDPVTLPNSEKEVRAWAKMTRGLFKEKDKSSV